MSKNALSWAVLGVLFGLVMLGLGIRQGMSVGEDNVRNKIKYEKEIEKLTPTETPKPTREISYRNIIDDKCGVSFLIPDNIATADAKIGIICSKMTASQEAALKKRSYVLTTISNKRIWIKSDGNLSELIRRTLENLDE